MNRAHFTFAATLVGASLLGGFALFAQTQPQAPPMKSILAGRKFTAPVKGPADVEYTRPVTKREKGMVVTTVVVKNASDAPIGRLRIAETWFDKDNQTLPSGAGLINGLLQPGEIQTIVIETPFNPRMNGNSFTFSHANGVVKPLRVRSLEPATEATSTTQKQ